MSSKRSIPLSQICCCDSHGTLTHSNTPSCSGIKNTPPFKNSKSDLRSAWELCVVCLLECDELACSHPVLASFLLHGFFSTVQPDPGMDRGEAGAQESVWHNCNNWGSVCEASRRERERENRSAVMVCITGRDDYTLVTYTHYSLWATLLNGDWVWACICIRLSLSGMEEEVFELWPQCGHIEDLRTLCNNETLLFTVMAVKVHSHWQPLNRWRSERRCAVGL